MSSIKKGSDSSEKKKEFVKIKPVESSPKIEPIVEPKRDEKSQIKMPDEKSSSYSVSEQLKQSRNLLNQLKK